MNRNRTVARPVIRNSAYRQAFERLDEVLEENTQTDNRETIRLMRMAMFGDVDKLQESGAVVIPQ